MYSDLWGSLAKFRMLVLDQMQGGLASLGLDLSLPQSVALQCIANGAPLTVSALQAQLRRSQATTSHLVAQLELRGLVERADDPADARRTLVRLSKEGRRAMTRLEHIRKQGFEQVINRLPAPVRRQLEEALRATVEALR